MSTTQATTEYSYNIYWSDPIFSPNINFSISQTPNFGDSDAFALLATLQAALPSAWGAHGSVQKSDSSSTSYTTNYASTPPSFS